MSVDFAAVLTRMVEVKASDVHLSPGFAPAVRVRGRITPLEDHAPLTPQDTREIVYSILNDAQRKKFENQQQLDFAYMIPGVARFRVNCFFQRGAISAAFRHIPEVIEGLDTLGLPLVLEEFTRKPRGFVLVTGPTGSGKSTTLASMVDMINEEREEHILTIEDPIEFLHIHKKGTVHQRELHSDTPTFALALRAALRQAPKVILVGEMRDRETIEVALTAAETGHLVFSTLHTIDASKTVERIIGTFEAADQQGVRARMAACFRYIISQRLVPKKKGGRLAVLEILKATLRTREYLEEGEGDGRSLLDAMRDGELDGMQHFDGEIERLVRSDAITFTTAMLYATNAGNLRVQLADIAQHEEVSA